MRFLGSEMTLSPLSIQFCTGNLAFYLKGPYSDVVVGVQCGSPLLTSFCSNNLNIISRGPLQKLLKNKKRPIISILPQEVLCGSRCRCAMWEPTFD